MLELSLKDSTEMANGSKPVDALRARPTMEEVGLSFDWHYVAAL